MSFSAAGDIIEHYQAENRRLEQQLARTAELQYEWASIINGLACEILDGIRQESIDMANDAIAMVAPCLGLGEE